MLVFKVAVIVKPSELTKALLMSAALKARSTVVAFNAVSESKS